MRPVFKRIKIEGALFSNTLKPTGKVDPLEISLQRILPWIQRVSLPSFLHSKTAKLPGPARQGDTATIILLNLKEIRRS